jgi:hypothetical protein
LGAGGRAAKSRLRDEGEAKNYSLREVFHASSEDITVASDARLEVSRLYITSWAVLR